MKTILGLDLGTNSIGWSLIKTNFEKKEGNIIGLGSRIIPMSQAILSEFGKGNTESQTAKRTEYRGKRRLIQRTLLRRERLHRVLNIIGFLPKHYSEAIDFEKRLGQFKNNTEVKLNYRKNSEGKHEFIFMASFNEMIEEFKKAQPDLFYKKKNGKETKIPYDWTLYYLRKKALTEKITKEELAWIILNFNQKRGYYQLRGEDETDETKNEDFYPLKVKEVQATEDKNAKGVWYNVILENGWVYRRQSKESLESWIGKIKEFIVTTNKEKDGSLKLDKEGNVKRSFRAVDSEKDWIAIKTKTEQDIDKSNKTVGQYIYDTLLQKPNQKIRGKLVKTIERKFYKDELEQILKIQIENHTELLDRKLYQSCIDELYPRNEAHQNNIKDKGFDYLFMDDIIFYQRPLKSKKSTISDCPYEYREFKINGVLQPKQYLKAIPKSHPLFQEFRLWQFLRNLKIYKLEGKKDEDITTQLIQTEADWVALFDFLNDKKEIEQHQLLKYFSDLKLIPKQKKEAKNYRWNYVEDKKYPCNETKAQFLSRLKKVNSLINPALFLKEKTKLGKGENAKLVSREEQLWHIVYSVTDKVEFEKAIENFAKKSELDQDSFEKNFKKFPPYKSDFGAYSVKAIKKLLPLMRRGKYWDENAITNDVKNRINNIKERLESINYDEEVFKKDKQNRLQTIADDEVPKQFLKSFVAFKDKNHFSGLNTYQACYAVYEKHSEAGDLCHWRTPQDITNYLNDFKQHSLRNPIVEQVVTETLRTVRDIWVKFGKSEENFFNEIHIELGREMKNPAGKREAMSKRNTENENTNQRIKAILQELKDDGARAHSPSHQEILKIYEEGVYQSVDVADDIEKIRKSSSPTKSEINKYKLWLEQGYISPYTGQIIPLTKLFTHHYEIEHIIPQSRYFDNSLSNKVICESEINRDKSNMTAYEYILKKGGSIVDGIKILGNNHYESHCERYFKKNRTKLKNLLSEDVPEGFINRQLNDSRYISTLVKGLLSNLVREYNEKEATSKHIIPVTGSITSKLKQDWGLNDKWNELILPRFRRLNELTKSSDFTTKNTNGVIIPTVPDELSRGFNKKRIDHRHHALDALIIACCTKKHTNYLGALNIEKNNYGLRDALLIKSDKGDYTKHFLMPWSNFTIEAKNHLEKTVISFKKNTRVINKTNNKTLQWVEKEGQWKKQLVQQTKGDNWAIRKPMHEETYSGLIILPGINLKPGEIITSTRKALDKSFNIKKILKITDTGIQKILLNYLKQEKFRKYDKKGKSYYDAEIAFSYENLTELNDNIKIFNNGKEHKPIYKVKIYEKGKGRFQVGLSIDNNKKYVQGAPNLFFAIYQDEAGNRKYETIPLNEVIEHQKQVAHLPKNERTEIPVKNVLGPKSKEVAVQFLFSLSPNDLVYVPTNEEIKYPSSVNFENLTKEQVERIYKMVSSSGNQCFFIRNDVTTTINGNMNITGNKVKINEFTSLNKMEKNIEGLMVKERCWKLKVDRLGIVSKA